MRSGHIVEYFRHVWNDTKVACAVIDLNMEIVEVNQFFSAELEYTTSQLVGLHIDEITSADFRGQGVEEIQRVFSGDLVSFVQHKNYRTRSGIDKPALASSFPIYDGDEIDHFFSVVLFDSYDSDVLTRLAVAEAQATAFRGVVESMASKDNKTTVNVDAGNTTTNNSSRVVFAVVIAIGIFGTAWVIGQLGGSLSATDGEREVQIEGEGQD